jgi:ParB-like chromosome segregation protein Spo0J
MNEKILSIEEIKTIPELYPRTKVDWLTAYDYSQKMRAGEVFPPITVAHYNNEYILVDGWHRIEALKILGEKYIRATVIKVKDEREIFVQAVKLNITHGRPLSPYEKALIIKRLGEMNFTKEEISQIVKIPLDKIEKFVVERVRKVTVGTETKEVVLKKIISKVELPEDFDTELQESLSVRTQVKLLDELIVLLENNLIEIENDKVKERLIKAYSLIQSLFEKMGVIK